MEEELSAEALERGLRVIVIADRCAAGGDEDFRFSSAERSRDLFHPVARDAEQDGLGASLARKLRERAELRGGSLSRVPGLTFFPRGRASIEDGRLFFSPGAQQSSMQIASWSAVNALGQIEPGTGKLNPGDVLDVLLLGAPEAA